MYVCVEAPKEESVRGLGVDGVLLLMFRLNQGWLCSHRKEGRRCYGREGRRWPAGYGCRERKWRVKRGFRRSSCGLCQLEVSVVCRLKWEVRDGDRRGWESGRNGKQKRGGRRRRGEKKGSFVQQTEQKGSVSERVEKKGERARERGQKTRYK